MRRYVEMGYLQPKCIAIIPYVCNQSWKGFMASRMVTPPQITVYIYEYEEDEYSVANLAE